MYTILPEKPINMYMVEIVDILFTKCTITSEINKIIINIF